MHFNKMCLVFSDSFTTLRNSLCRVSVSNQSVPPFVQDLYKSNFHRQVHFSSIIHPLSMIDTAALYMTSATFHSWGFSIHMENSYDKRSFALWSFLSSCNDEYDDTGEAPSVFGANYVIPTRALPRTFRGRGFGRAFTSCYVMVILR